MRIGRLRHALLARHRRGVIGIIGAGAEDGQRQRHWRQQFGLGQRLTLGAALGCVLGGAGHGLLQRRFGRFPVGEDAGDGGIDRLAGELGGVEHLVANDDARARTVARSICRELVSRPLIAGHCIASLTKFPKFVVAYLGWRRLNPPVIPAAPRSGEPGIHIR